jgi:hypothetical protein
MELDVEKTMHPIGGFAGDRVLNEGALSRAGRADDRCHGVERNR